MYVSQKVILKTKQNTVYYVDVSRTFSTDCTEIHSALRYQMDIWSSTDCGSAEKCRYEVSYSTMHDSKRKVQYIGGLIGPWQRTLELLLGARDLLIGP